MRTLYHFQYSPFSRRTRLALAHKGLDCELREPRETPAFLEEARKLVPFRTIPVLVDGGQAMGDSTAIVHWLDRAYASGPRLWPTGEDAAEAFQSPPSSTSSSMASSTRARATMPCATTPHGPR